MTAQKTRSPIRQKIIDFTDSEPEWALPALLNFLKRFKAGDDGEASAQKWRDERAEAEAAHLAKQE